MAEHKGLSISIALGTLLIPLTAFAASAMVGDGVAGDEDVAVAATVPEISVPSATGTADDLTAACGPAGADLVDAESDGSITDIQAAALDALREICAQQGLPLPGPVSEPVPLVTVTESGPTLTVSSVASDHDDDHDEDDDNDHDHDDDEDDDEDDD